MTAPTEKTCRTCGRRIAPRRKWRDDFEQVQYCSERCRRNKPGPVDRALEHAIESLLATRTAGATICPSEAARTVGGEDWRGLLERARMAARRLVATGRIEITQKSRVVDPSTAKGPIRLRRASRV